jgi:predicted 3-demethylubiquinone-9 3-methyltransferase (glyoxalase superfamily)
MTPPASTGSVLTRRNKREATEGGRDVPSPLNGGSDFTFNEAVSFVIECDDQAEVDRLWDRLTTDGGEPGPCGWLKDRFGLSWQIVPRRLNELLGDPDEGRARRAMDAMLQMHKIDVVGLERAADAA